jgi:hypothetical protein
MNADDVANALSNAHAQGHIIMGPEQPIQPGQAAMDAGSTDAIVGEGIYRKWTRDLKKGGIGLQAADGMKLLINSITKLEQRVGTLEQKK